MSLRDLARAAYSSKSHLQEFETGRATPSAVTAKAIDDALGAGGELATLATTQADDMNSAGPSDDEIESVELARRVDASDVGDATLRRIELAIDDLATAYATTPPAALLPEVRRHLSYVARLVGARKTLGQHRRLLVAGGWLSLLAATLDIDLKQRGPAAARLETARQLARHAEHTEMLAWTIETRAWDALTEGDYPRAVKLAQQAQRLAPQGSSAHIQATAQEGRAWARMRQQAQTRDALDRLALLVRPLPQPDRPEHHYQYDPAKALSYTATTLAWAGDPTAEQYAREVIRHLETAADGVSRPRRIASARLDLGLALLAAGQPDEAAAQGVTAVTSGRVVPSNWWRAEELTAGVQRAGIPEADDLLDALRAYCRPSTSADGGGQQPDA